MVMGYIWTGNSLYTMTCLIGVCISYHELGALLAQCTSHYSVHNVHCRYRVQLH